MRSTKVLLLFIAFFDYVGIGLIYPMFSSMIFDPDYPIVAHETSISLRGVYLGILMATMPLFQFFAAPFWGALSDKIGRKKPLIFSIGVAVIGYILAVFSTSIYSLALLMLSRGIIGFASGNISILQASLVDLSDEKSKIKNFGLFSMAYGTGFCLGPFLGGVLSQHSYKLPFIVGACVLFINLLFCQKFLQDTLTQKKPDDTRPKLGLDAIKQALGSKALRGTFFACFLHNFGWSYFFEFIPVFLFQVMHFSKMNLGSFYAAAGFFYAFSVGILIRPIVNRFKPLALFQVGLALTACVILSMGFLENPNFLWLVLFLMCFTVALVTPSANAFVSANTDSLNQGKILGSLNSMNCIALIISPLMSGALVGHFPKMPIYLGGAVILFASIVSIFFHKKDSKAVS